MQRFNQDELSQQMFAASLDGGATTNALTTTAVTTTVGAKSSVDWG